MRSLAVVGFVAAATVACSRQHIAAAGISTECARPDVRLVDARLPTTDDLRSVFGRVVEFDDRPIAGASVRLLGDSMRSVRTDSAGRFRFDGVARGRYQLRALSLGHSAAAESISVPLTTRGLEVRLAIQNDIVFCANERILAERPVLALRRADSVAIERTLPDGSRLRHTVVAISTRDGAQFHSRIANVGNVRASITILCYPQAEGPVLKQLVSVGPACYGTGREMEPGDSLIVVTGGPLRGRTGRYRFHVHAIDPHLLDIALDLDIVEVNRDL